MGAHGRSWALPALASGRGDKSGEATGAARNASARCWRAEIRHSPRGQLGRRAVTDQSVLQHSLPSHPASETGFILMWLRAQLVFAKKTTPSISRRIECPADSPITR